MEARVQHCLHSLLIKLISVTNIIICKSQTVSSLSNGAIGGLLGEINQVRFV